ncbi:hypothetical protein H1R20_g5808, partial [Candolleomyces eurysporus]
MSSNGTCHKHHAPEDPPGLFQNGSAVFQAHHVGWIVCGSFTAVAAVASFWLIDKHLQWYTNKREQRYIVRLLFLVPIYALISFASFLFWNNATPLILVRDAYEAIVLTAFFYLLLVYLSPDPEEQKRIFLRAGLSKANDQAARQKGAKLLRWMWPLGFIKKKPKDGLYFLQLMKWGVLQYCVIRPVTTLIAVILDYAGYYCESSWSPVWGHLWIVIIISISVTIAMYCLIQLYLPVSKELKHHRPILKLFSVKAVVFLTFWQATLLSGLSMLGVVKDTKYMTAEDINIGIGAILECFEMMIFAFVHIKAFTYKPYRPFHNPASKDPPPQRTPRFRSLGHALDFRETFREIWTGCIYMFDKMRGREPSPDFSARRAAHYERAFGQSRPSQLENKVKVEGVAKKSKLNSKLTPSSDITVNQQVEVDVAGERQWLGLGDDYGYGLGYFRRERSEGLSVQIEKELQQRGYGANDSVHAVQGSTGHGSSKPLESAIPIRRERSWWRNLYDQISTSQSSYPKEVPETNLTPSLPRRLQSKPRSRRQSEAQHTLLQQGDHDLDDPPPSSYLNAETYSPDLLPKFNRVSPSESGASIDTDVLPPLSYQGRRRSYRPKTHKHSGSGAALLPRRPLDSPPPESSIDVVELAPHGSDRNDLLSVPTSSYYNRSDSLLNRIFPPSEVGSFEGRSRVETDSAYSLPHAEGPLGQPRATPSGRLVLTSSPRSSTSEFGITGDRRQHVHEQVYHPSASTYALHAPWTADILHHPGSVSHASDINNEYGEPPPLPEKDISYVPSFRRPHRRDPAHSRHRTPIDSAASLPSLPEGVQFTAPLPPWLVSQNDTERSSTLVDTPTSPQSAYFSDNRSSYADSQWSSPPTPHAKPIRRKSSDISAHPPLPSGAAAPSMVPYELQPPPQTQAWSESCHVDPDVTDTPPLHGSQYPESADDNIVFPPPRTCSTAFLRDRDDGRCYANTGSRSSPFSTARRL